MEFLKNLVFDLASGREIYDEEQGRVMSKREASDAIRKVCFEKLGLTKDSTPKQIRRALQSEKAIELFQVIEEVIDVVINEHWKDNEFFNQFVEIRNMQDGDMNEFWVDDDVILNVAKVSGDNHDLVMQKLGAGQSYNVPTGKYAVKVGTDIRLFLTGRKDWSEFVNAVARAYNKKLQEDLFAEFMNGVTLLPAPKRLTYTAALTPTVKDKFDLMISDVATVNECDVVIMGTKVALKKLNNLYTATNGISWVSASAKEAVMSTGILGNYEGVNLLEIPQRLENHIVNSDGEFVNKLMSDDVLIIMPVVMDKPVKMVDYGETSLEVTEAGETMNDQQSYEVQRWMGISTIMTRYYGVWHLN